MLSPKMTRPTPLGWARISDTVVSVFPYAGTIWSGHEAVVCLVELDPQPLSARRGAASASARAGARGVSVVLARGRPSPRLQPPGRGSRRCNDGLHPPLAPNARVHPTYG